MTKIESREFKVNLMLIKSWKILSWAALFVAVMYIVTGFIKDFENIVFGVCWFVITFLWYKNYLWMKNTPAVIINEKDITVIRSMVLPSRKASWTDIKEIERKKRKLILWLSNGEKIVIRFSIINRVEREDLVKILQQAAKDFGISMNQ